jgi:hypothetical protein
MAQDEHRDVTQQERPPQAVTCESAKDLLDKINLEIATFEAKRLGELKSELDAFVKKQDALVADYKAKYPALRKLWCDRQVAVERLCAHMRCEFPLKEEKWKKLVADCICKPMHLLCCQERQVAQRKRCCSGPLQRTRDAALTTFDTAKKRLDGLTNLASRVDTILADNAKLIGDIEKLPSGERAVALYLFMKLRQAHVSVAPKGDVSDDLTKVCAEFDPNTLCSDVFKQPCKPDDGGCAPKDGATETGGCTQPAPDGPYLIHPDNYREALDCAWRDYHRAKEAFAKAEADVKKSPDDLESLIKKLAKDTEGLDDAIKKCLRDANVQEDPCKDDQPKKSGY